MKNLTSQIDWKKCVGLVPAIIQNAENGTVLMMGYMSPSALEKTLKTKKVWFYSRTKKRLWMKGEISKNILRVESMRSDCDKDTLLVNVLPEGPTCHTGEVSCFGSSTFKNTFASLYEVILDRRSKMPKKSYTSFLFKKGTNKICEKIAEESEEVIRAAKKETKKRLIEESVDLTYHLFVLLAQKNITFAEFTAEIERRRR